MSQTGNMHEYGESNIRLIEPDESMEKRAEEECQQVLADYESDGMEEPQTRIIRNHPLSKYECTGLSMKSFNFKNNPIDPQLIRKIQRMIIAIKEREAKESAADQTNHEPSHNQPSKQFSDSNKGELVINPTPESELKPKCLNELAKDQIQEEQSSDLSREDNRSTEEVHNPEAMSIDENANIVEDEDDLINKIKLLIKKDKSKIAKIKRILNENLNESTNDEYLINLNSSYKNDTFTSVFEDSKSQLISENFNEQLQVDVSQANDQKPGSMSLPIKQSQDSHETSPDLVQIIRKKFEQHIKQKHNDNVNCSTRTVQHPQWSAPVSPVRHAMLHNPRPVIEKSQPISINHKISYSKMARHEYYNMQRNLYHRCNQTFANQPQPMAYNPQYIGIHQQQQPNLYVNQQQTLMMNYHSNSCPNNHIQMGNTHFIPSMQHFMINRFNHSNIP